MMEQSRRLGVSLSNLFAVVEGSSVASFGYVVSHGQCILATK